MKERERLEEEAGPLAAHSLQKYRSITQNEVFARFDPALFKLLSINVVVRHDHQKHQFLFEFLLILFDVDF